MPDQDQINEMEWLNPENWSLGFYFSKLDSRVLVPKQRPWMGWTLNIGQRSGALWLLGTFAGIILMLVAVVLMVSFIAYGARV